MNNDVKEILKQIECYKNKELCLILLSQKENNALLNYITNLQQEINKLTAESTEWESKYYDLQQENEDLNEENELVRCDIHNAYSSEKGAIRELEDYKSRCEKAIEYIQNENNITKHGIYPNYTYEVDTKDLLNILQNGSDSQ